MHKVNIHQAKTHLSRLVDRVAGGEEILIAKNGRPMAKDEAVDLDTFEEVVDLPAWTEIERRFRKG